MPFFTPLRRTSFLDGHLLSAGPLVSVLDRIDCGPRKTEETNLVKVHLHFQRDKDMNQRKKKKNIHTVLTSS